MIWFALTVVGTMAGYPYLVLVGLVLQAANLLAGRRSVFESWPIGLMLVLTVGYVPYWIQWLVGATTVTEVSSRIWSLSLGLVFLIGHGIRQRSHASYVSAKLRGVLPSLLVVVFATWKSFLDPESFLSAFLAGGDHNRHISIVRSMTGLSQFPYWPNPFRLFEYPNGIHYLVANLSALGTNGLDVPQVAWVNIVGAWFDWVQFAAVIQLAFLLVRRSGRLGFRVVVFSAVCFAVSSYPGFVHQLVWSGFTTSLGLTWLLMIPLGFGEDFVALSRRSRVVVFILYTYSLWLTYPLLVAAPIVSLVSLSKIACHTSKRLARRNRVSKSQYWQGSPGLAVVLALLTSLSPLVLGRTLDPVVKSLSLDGATATANFFTVMFWCALVFLFTLTPRQFDQVRRVDGRDIQDNFVAAVFGAVVGFLLIVVWTTDRGWTDQPYYIQKLLWILLFIAIPYVCGYLADMLERLRNPLSSILNISLSQVGLLLVVGTVFIPTLVYGRVPVTATQHGTVDWFARTLLSEGIDQSLTRAVVAYPTDTQGTHIGNLALWELSMDRLHVDVATSGNFYVICREISGGKANFILTGPSGIEGLLEFGCPTDRTYLVEGEPVAIPNPVPTVLQTNQVKVVGSSPDLQKYLGRGFGGDEKYVRWASGLNSQIVFQNPDSERLSEIVIEFVAPASVPSGRRVTVSVNGVQTTTLPLIKDEIGTLRLPIRTYVPDGKFVVEFDCNWSVEEMSAENFDKPWGACLGVRSLEVE